MSSEYSQETLFLALTVAGFLLPWVVQLVKEDLGLSDKTALWATFVVAFFGAVLAGAVVGDLFAPIPAGDPTAVVGELVARTMWVFGLATLVYKSLKGKAGLKSAKKRG